MYAPVLMTVLVWNPFMVSAACFKPKTIVIIMFMQGNLKVTKALQHSRSILSPDMCLYHLFLELVSGPWPGAPDSSYSRVFVIKTPKKQTMPKQHPFLSLPLLLLRTTWLPSCQERPFLVKVTLQDSTCKAPRAELPAKS